MLHAHTGGRVVNSWSSECTHLVMTNLNVTIKVNTVYYMYMYMYVLQMCNFKYNITVKQYLCPNLWEPSAGRVNNYLYCIHVHVNI